METITSEAQWFEKLTSISQELQLERMNKQLAAEKAAENSGTEDTDSDSDDNDSDLDNPGINDDDNENEVRVEAQPSLVDKLKRQMSPLFASQPKFKTVCSQTNNCLFWSNFTKYRSYKPRLDDPIDALQKQEDDLKYVLYLCKHNLTELDLQEYSSSRILQMINTNLPTLKKLSLVFNEVVSEDCEIFFSNNMPRLEELAIEWNCGNSTLPIILVKLIEQVGETLKRLDISNLEDEYQPYLPDSLVPVFSQLIHLEELVIWGFAHLNQASIQSIAEIKSLITLELVTNWKEDLQCDMYPIGNLKNLKTLDIGTDFGVTDEFLINLSKNAKNLTELTIVGTNITNNGIMALDKFTELKKFDIGLYELQKRNTFITDESFQYLFNNKLKELDISNCIKITNHSVITIVKKCTNLRWLKINNTNVTAKVAKELTYLTKDRRKFLYLWVPFRDRHYTFELFKSDKVFFRTESNNLSIDTY